MRYGAPEIFNADQGSQFTDEDFTRPLLDNRVRVSMDGKGRWIDNVFVERLRMSVENEDFTCMPTQWFSALASYFNFYNARRPRQSLDYRSPTRCISESTHSSRSRMKHG
ncbi:hypothetical protein ACFS07_35035 [Undibacterium arcticum]